MQPFFVWVATVGPLSKYSYTPNFFTTFTPSYHNNNSLTVPVNPTVTAKSKTNGNLPRANSQTQ
jgi:hypothetical protein